jgi:uncharacterized OsmC-like protein
MIQYPLFFPVQSKATSGVESSWKTQTSDTPLTTAIPPEFEGKGGGFSPEDYFGMALLNCFIATFKVVAEKSKLGFNEIEAKGNLSVDRNEKGNPVMKSFDMSVTLHGAQDVERAKRLLEKTSQLCMIHQSVKTEIKIEFHVS